MNCGADGDLLLEVGARDDATLQPELKFLGLKRGKKIAESKKLFWFYDVLWVFNSPKETNWFAMINNTSRPDPPFRMLRSSDLLP